MLSCSSRLGCWWFLEYIKLCWVTLWLTKMRNWTEKLQERSRNARARSQQGNSTHKTSSSVLSKHKRFSVSLKGSKAQNNQFMFSLLLSETWIWTCVEMFCNFESLDEKCCGFQSYKGQENALLLYIRLGFFK